MRILSVDDEEMTVEYMRRLFRQIEPEAEFSGFTEPEAALSHLSKHSADIALLDIEMGADNGLALAKRCKELCPQLNIIFVTGYSQYTMDALKLHASGYLIKPVRMDDLRAELENLRHPLPSKTGHRVRIQTFGNFEVFVDGKPLVMPVAKCRECLAYLVDRKGARVTVAELAAVLWEDQVYGKNVQNNTYRVICDMMKQLKNRGIEEIVIKTRKDIAIHTEKVDCDYYRFLSGDVSQINAFLGEYMSNYAWAEFTLAALEKIKEK